MRKITYHPIWSKVIAGLILSIIFWLLSEVRQINWGQLNARNIKSYLEYFFIEVVIIIVASTLLVLAIIEVFKKIHLLINKKSPEKHSDTTIKEKLPNLGKKTTDFFTDRLLDAFPKLEGFEWITNSKKIIEKLSILLREPLEFNFNSNSLVNSQTTPIWIFSRNTSMKIDSFRVLRYPQLSGLIKGKVLICKNEFLIKKLGAYHSKEKNHLDLIYIETYPNKNIRLFTKKKEKMINTKDAEFKPKSSSRINFIICAQHSPYNSEEFNQLLTNDFDLILNKEKSFEDVFKQMKQL